MQVLMLTASMNGGGTERVIAVLANYLIQHDIDVTIAMTASDQVVYELDPHIKVLQLGNRTGGSIKKRLERVSRIRECYKEGSGQIIVSFGTETNMFALLAGIGLRNRIIISERNDPNQCKFKGLRNLIYRLADNLVFQTEDARRCFPKKIAKKGVVIPNPLAKEMEKDFSGERTHDIVAVGRLEPQKNHRMLLQAYQLFDRKYPEHRLVLYGKGFLQEELETFAKELGIEQKVVFAGFTQEVEKQIQNAAMYVLSSDYEGISNSLMEAMALGLPVISTDCPIGGSKMLISDKRNGMLTPVGDMEAFAAAMCYVAEDAERAEEMGRKAEYVRQAYSVEVICQKWIAELKR